MEGGPEVEVPEAEAEGHASARHAPALLAVAGVGPPDDEVATGGGKVHAPEGVGEGVLADLPPRATDLALLRRRSGGGGKGEGRRGGGRRRRRLGGWGGATCAGFPLPPPDPDLLLPLPPLPPCPVVPVPEVNL